MEPRKMTLFPKTLEAALAAERSLWTIGDALLKETTDEFGGKRGLQACANELAANGVSYAVSTLCELRGTAATFPKERRQHKLPFAAYKVAGTPDNLDTIVRFAKKAGTKITQYYIQDTLRALREEERNK